MAICQESFRAQGHSVHSPWHHLQSVRDTSVCIKPRNACWSSVEISVVPAVNHKFLPVQFSFWCSCSRTSEWFLICLLWNMNCWRMLIGGSCHLLRETSLKIMICLKEVSGWGRRAGRHLQSVSVQAQCTHRVLINKALHKSWFISWWSYCTEEDFLWLCCPSRWLCLASWGLSWIPGPAAWKPLCALSGAKRELCFLLDGFDDAQQLSSAGSICGKQLVFGDCGFSGYTCQSDSSGLIADAVIRLNSLPASHTALWLSFISSDI